MRKEELNIQYGRTSPEDEAYRENREFEKEWNRGDLAADVFGYETVNDLDRWRTMLAREGRALVRGKKVGSKKIADVVRAELTASKDKLFDAVYHPQAFWSVITGTSSPTISFFEEALKDDEFRQQLDSSGVPQEAGFEVKTLKPIVLMHMLEDGVIPDALYERMLRIHAENFRAKQKVFEKVLPQMKKEFLKKVRNAIEKKRFPLTEDFVERIFDETSIRLKDALVAQLEEAHGDYDVRKGVIGIAEQMPERLGGQVFAHEVLHALSGRTVSAERFVSGKETEDDLRFFEHQRIGTHFYSELQSLTPRFRWLNEAITEKLAMELCGASEGAYPEERELFALLLTKGKHPIEEKFFIDAYFESYDPRHPEKVPAWKTMMFVLNQSYRPGFLVELDKTIERDGMERAVNLVRNWKPER